MFFRTLSVFLTLSLAVSLSAGSGIASDSQVQETRSSELSPLSPREKYLASFIAALLEKAPEKQCAMLLEVVAAAPEEPAPAAALLRCAEKRPVRKFPIARFNEVWKKNPLNFELARCGIIANTAYGTAPEKIWELLKPLAELAPEKVIALPGATPGNYATVAEFSLSNLLKTNNFAPVQKLFSSWFAPNKGNWKPSEAWQDALAPVFAKALFTAKLRMQIRKDPAYSSCEKDFHLAYHAAKTALPRANSLQSFGILADFFQRFKDYEELRRAGTLAMQRIPSRQGAILKHATSIGAGDKAGFEESVALILKYNPRFDASESRVKMLLNGGHFAQAEEELKRLPAKSVWEQRQRLLMLQKRYKELHDLLKARMEQGGIPDAATGIQLLTVAEHLKQKEPYTQGREILKPLLNRPLIANAVGYVGAVLDIDLEQNRKLIEYALKKEPGNAAYMDSLAWVLYKEKKLEEAEKWIEKSLLAADPFEGISVILEHAGDIAAARGKDSRSFYKMALEYLRFDQDADSAALKRKLETK